MPPDTLVFPAPRDYAPYQAGPFRLSMGLRPLDLPEWIEPDPHMAAELAEKERLLRDRRDEVLAILPEALEGSTELLELLAVYLPEQFPTLYARSGQHLTNRVTQQTWNLSEAKYHPLDLAGRLVQEDLCLMQRDPGTGQYRLVGASVCFPTRWRLTDKIGHSLGAIHEPVPHYQSDLDSTMDRFFDRMKVERPVWRVNWSLIDDPALFQPKGHGRRDVNPNITADNAGDTVWIRLERQTLRRLPQTGDILFTIRIYVHPLSTIKAHPERAGTLAAAIRALSPDMYGYKSLSLFSEQVLTWLDRLSIEPTTLQQF